MLSVLCCSYRPRASLCSITQPASEEVVRLTTIIAPTTTQPVPTLRIHNRSARLAHSHHFRSTRGKRRCRTVRRAVAEPDLACFGGAVEILAFEIVLGTAVPAETAAPVIVSWQTGTGGGHAGARTGDVAAVDGVAADVDVGDCGDVWRRRG